MIYETKSYFCIGWESEKASPTETEKPKRKSLIMTVQERYTASFIGKCGTSPFFT